MDNQPWRKPFSGLYNFKLREGSFPALFMTPAPRVGYWDGAGLLGGEVMNAGRRQGREVSQDLRSICRDELLQPLGQE